MKEERIDCPSGHGKMVLGGLSPRFLREYATGVSYLQDFEGVDDAFGSRANKDVSSLFGKLEDLYARSSSYVHATKETHMTRHATNADLKFDKEKAGVVESTARGFVKMAVAFLIAAHMEQFMRLNEYDKSIILEAFDTVEKHRFRKLFNV